MSLSIKKTEVPADLSGVLLIDKPAGISSFDIIRSLRRQTGVRKIGHVGTLDPAATGLMIMLFGSATKQARHLVGLDKLYQGEITLGATSSTGDREGTITKADSRQPSRADVAGALTALTGEISQIPSAYSAIKIGGVRAYKLARKGKEFLMPPRHVTIHKLKLQAYNYPVVGIEAEVSSGTYIRSLAVDVGHKLGTGAYLSQLRRMQIGKFSVTDAYRLSDVQSATLKSQLNAGLDLTKK